MDENRSFRELIDALRQGDARAAEELLRRYGPTVRLVVRARLTDPGLRRLLDSMDICQSVLADFFTGDALTGYDLDRPEQLVKLLQTMAEHKVINHWHKQRAARRDYRRLEPGPPSADAAAASDPSPSTAAASRELLEEFRRRLSPEDRRIAEQRDQGFSWEEIAAGLGKKADAVRIGFQRRAARIAAELGMAD
jgi:RNA polymerase sigma factor (sigma-70 family)